MPSSFNSTQVGLANSPKDAISSLKFSQDPSSTRFAVSSWDKNVYLYDLKEEDGSIGEGRLVKTFEHRAPVLDVCFGESDDELFSAGLDWDARRIDVTSSEQSVLSSHNAGARSIVHSKEHSIVISASWDSTLHIHHYKDPTLTPATIDLPSKPFSLSISPTKLVVAMASRALYIYDLKALSMFSEQSNEAPPNKIGAEPWQRRESSLKFMTRAVACMPNDAGYASSSIEGRVAVEWFDPSEEFQSRKYAFKCHRQANPQGVDIVYPVNALAFHPVHGTFASGGGDGVIALWDGIAKRRIRHYQNYPASIAALAFSANGKYLAIGVSPGFEDGNDDVNEGVIKVFIRELGDSEAKGKGAK